jgi:hypothetical protein
MARRKIGCRQKRINITDKSLQEFPGHLLSLDLLPKETGKILQSGEGQLTELRIDALLPAEMAMRAEELGVRKAEMRFLKMVMLSIFAGAFIALGAIFATTVSAGSVGQWQSDNSRTAA